MLKILKKKILLICFNFLLGGPWVTLLAHPLHDDGVFYSQASQDQFVNLLLYELLGKQDEGYYLEIGAGEPVFINNTYFFEKNCGWKGVSLDISGRYSWHPRQNPLLIENAVTADYREILKSFPRVIDYLTLDIDDQYDAVLNKIPFDTYIFRIITIEHDYFKLGDHFRSAERSILKELGYHMLCPDVSIVTGAIFEDWWIHPNVFPVDVFAKLTSLNLNAKNHDQIINAIKSLLQ